jgi:hypothetical protein
VACAVRWWILVIVAVRIGCGVSGDGGERRVWAGVEDGESGLSELVGGGEEVVGDGVRSFVGSIEALRSAGACAWDVLERSRMLSGVECGFRRTVLVAGRVRTGRELDREGRC